MGQVSVDPAELIALGRLVAVVREDLHAMHTKAAGLRARALGSDVVENALDEFADHWRYGLGRLRESAGLVAEALTAAGHSYRELDEGLAAGIRTAAAGPERP